MTKPPLKVSESGNSKSNKPNHNVIIQGDVHLTANDIAELRKLADSHPDLATRITADRREFVILENNTTRLGMILAVILGLALIIGTSFTLVKLGWWQSIMFVGALLGISHVLRTFLKGEFSETSWFGHIMSGKPKSKPSDETDPPS